MSKRANRAEQALLELIWNNPLRNDRHVYELRLSLWGLGLIDERPSPAAFGVVLDSAEHEDAYAYHAGELSFSISHHEE